MVQLSTHWGDPLPGNGPPVRRFLSNYFDILFTNAKVLKHVDVDRIIVSLFSPGGSTQQCNMAPGML